MPTWRTAALAAGVAGLLVSGTPTHAGQPPAEVCSPAPAECLTAPATRVVIHVPAPEVIFKEAPPTTVALPAATACPVAAAPERQRLFHRPEPRAIPVVLQQPAPPVMMAPAPQMTVPVVYAQPAPMPVQTVPSQYASVLAAPPMQMVPVAMQAAPACQRAPDPGDRELRRDVDGLKDRADKTDNDLAELSARIKKLSTRVDDVVDLLKKHDEVLIRQHNDIEQLKKDIKQGKMNKEG
jgi:hypothetical protein